MHAPSWNAFKIDTTAPPLLDISRAISLVCLFGLWGASTNAAPQVHLIIWWPCPLASADWFFRPKSGGVIGAVVAGFRVSRYVSVTVSDPLRPHWLTHFTSLVRPVLLGRAASRCSQHSVRHWICVWAARARTREMLIRRSRLPPPPGGARICNFPGLSVKFYEWKTLVGVLVIHGDKEFCRRLG